MDVEPDEDIEQIAIATRDLALGLEKPPPGEDDDDDEDGADIQDPGEWSAEQRFKVDRDRLS